MRGTRGRWPRPRRKRQRRPRWVPPYCGLFLFRFPAPAVQLLRHLLKQRGVMWENDSFPSFFTYSLSTGFPRLSLGASASRVAEAVGALQTCSPSSSARSELTEATFRIRNTSATGDNIAWLSGMTLRNLVQSFPRLYTFDCFVFVSLHLQ